MLKICWSRAAQRRVASVGASRGAGTIANGVPASAGSARRRIPRGRLLLGLVALMLFATALVMWWNRVLAPRWRKRSAPSL